MLGGSCTPANLHELLSRAMASPQTLSDKEWAAVGRVRHYREAGVGFVARPAHDRAGIFKKASNLNYTLRLGDKIAGGEALLPLLEADGEFAQGYAEGDIQTHEIILLLDKDSGVHENIIEAVVPEFVADADLAYAQCATNTKNLSDNYLAKALGYHTNNLFHNIWPCKALQGYFVPLVGHNVFLRKSHLEESGGWPENRVSEDYDKALGFYNRGYHGKYMQIAGLEFTEYVSRTFAEETAKQFRYSYGLMEMLLQGTIRLGKTRGCDILYMILYFCSLVNAVMLLPTALLEAHFGNVHLLWAGFIFCNMAFVLLPCFRSLCMGRRLPREQRINLGHTCVLALAFLGHAYSRLAGVGRYFADKVKRNPRPFPSTNVDALGYRFMDGVRILGGYLRRNMGFIVIAALCVERGLFMLSRAYVGVPTLLAYSYIFFFSVLAPVLLTPQLYMRREERAAKVVSNSRQREFHSRRGSGKSGILCGNT
ncbi:MAG: glycosyltransferase family 2 protein [Peptococcaceae bacterium]|nr:glycosyltransferase family 2 protein [Peptococcaceae bacterium]